MLPKDKILFILLVLFRNFYVYLAGVNFNLTDPIG